MRARGATLLLALLAVVLAGALAELFRLRFATGDVYPYGSSHRADPLGSKALHDTLAELPGVRVERHERPLPFLQGGAGTTVFLLGVDPWLLVDQDAELLAEAERLAAGGARVVLAFRPLARSPLGAGALVAGEGGGGDTDDARGGRDAARAKGPAGPGGAPLWGWRAKWLPLPAAGEPEATAAAAAPAEPELPRALALRSALVFEGVAAPWRVTYARGEDAVWVERRSGAGSLVVAADSYPFSNEGLQLARHADLLAWSLGGATRAVFDESHLGVVEESGVMVLARRYRLHGVLAALAVLAALFVWQAASPLLPPRALPPQHRVEGGDAASGLVRLLARGVAPKRLLATAAERWAHDCGRGQPAASAAVRAIAAEGGEVVAGYRRIRETLARLSARKGDHAG